MKLYSTPLSHFSRKIRILLDLYSIPCEILDIGNVASAHVSQFANNPIMKVPTVVDGGNWLIESDHIASYIVQKHDPSDKFQVHTKDLFDLNCRAVLNGIMDEEVKVILARRTGVPVENYSFFAKAMTSITNGLAWLESNYQKFDSQNPKYRDMHLVCLWDHLEYYDFIPLPYDNLRNIVSEISKNPIIAKSAPLILKPKS